MRVYLLTMCFGGFTLWLLYSLQACTTHTERKLSGTPKGIYIDKHGFQYKTLNILLLFNRQGLHGPLNLMNVADPANRQYCFFHKDRGLLSQSDAVIMKAELLLDEDEVPEHTLSHQQWIYFVWEAAKNNIISGHPQHNNKFNLSMTYSMQSDIPLPYGECIVTSKDRATVKEDIDDIVMIKDKFAAWMLSSCRSRSLRENVGRALLQYIPIDVYGDCGNRTCIEGTACDRYISRYKFTLAFENSLCGEYITEKVWRSFERNIVPVVFGGLDAYKSLLPAHSYIAVSDFSSIKDLADYLLLLNKNQTLYRRYFDWKYTHTCRHSKLRAKSLRVCQYLHKHIQDKKDNFTLHDVWNSESNKCIETEPYLAQLGVNGTVERPFEKPDVHIYDNMHRFGHV